MYQISAGAFIDLKHFWVCIEHPLVKEAFNQNKVTVKMDTDEVEEYLKRLKEHLDSNENDEIPIAHYENIGKSVIVKREIVVKLFDTLTGILDFVVTDGAIGINPNPNTRKEEINNESFN